MVVEEQVMAIYPYKLACIHISAMYINMHILHNSASGVGMCTLMHIIMCLQGSCYIWPYIEIL